MVKMMGGVFGFMLVVIASLGAFIISNIMMMVVMERRREIGILKSMGMKQWEILVLFLTEGTVLGFAGSAAGIAGGLLVNGLLSIKGLDFSKVMESVTIPIESVIYPQFDPVAIIQIFFTGVVISALMSLLPSRQAAKMNPIDAIKSV
jgi:putative ABC transport system permease protein